jgi:hypothetical protein
VPASSMKRTTRSRVWRRMGETNRATAVPVCGRAAAATRDAVARGVPCGCAIADTARVDLVAALRTLRLGHRARRPTDYEAAIGRTGNLGGESTLVPYRGVTRVAGAMECDGNPPSWTQQWHQKRHQRRCGCRGSAAMEPATPGCKHVH